MFPEWCNRTDRAITRFVDGEWKDENIADPLGQMLALLNDTRDRALVQRWGLWLVKRDTASGLKVCISLSTYIQGV